jgi:hypothetical protein
VSISAAAVRWGGAKLARRAARSVPFFGALIALATVGYAIRRKGVAGGTLDSAVNAIPFIGGLKNVAEVVRGRDFIPDRPSINARPPRGPA